MVGTSNIRKSRHDDVETDSDDDGAGLLDSDSADDGTSPIHRPSTLATSNTTAAEERRRRVMEFRHLHKVFFLRSELVQMP